MSNDNKTKPNSIDIEINETGDCFFCSAFDIDTTYPYALRNHIDPNEFEQSITNINNNFPRNYYSCTGFIGILIIIALGLTALGIGTIVSGFESRKKSEFGSIIGGCVFIIIGFFICFCSYRCFKNQIESVNLMRVAIEEESKKYEDRHCQWRLVPKQDESFLFLLGRHPVKKFRVIIDIDQTNIDVPTVVQSNLDFSGLNEQQQRLTA